MTLSQVAREDFSRAFLNQVEMGRSQPSTRVLRVIAHRLGAPIDYLVDGGSPLLELELEVERARLAMARGDAARALALAQRAMAERVPLASDARLCAAEALQALGRQEESRALLDAEEAALRARGDGDRLRRLKEIRSGRRSTSGPDEHERLGDRALREGRQEAALEHYRSARVLREHAAS